MHRTSIVIVGAGQAGVQLAASLRQQGFDEKIQLIGCEQDPPYQRPPLSKAYLLTKSGSLSLKAASFYEGNNIDLIVGETVTAVDIDHKRVRLNGGDAVEYDHLIFATGARNRVLPLPGQELNGVHSLRTREDADRLKAQ